MPLVPSVILGNLDNAPLEFDVLGSRALRLEPDATGGGAPNVIGGSVANFVATGVQGATIGGGGLTSLNGIPITAGANQVDGNFGTIGGGFGNYALGTGSVVGGGGIDGLGFGGNYASGPVSTIGGGFANNAGGYGAAIAGGQSNFASGDSAAVGGGSGNSVTGDFSTVSGGSFNQASGNGSFIGGGGYDRSGILGFGGFTSVGNIASGLASAVLGGISNTVTGNYATVAGGATNVAAGQFSFAAGQNAQALNDGSFVWADTQPTPFFSTVNDSFNVRAQGGVNFLTSGAGLKVDGQAILAVGSSGSGLLIQAGVTGDGAPNIIGGSLANTVTAGVTGATIGGGGAQSYGAQTYVNSVTDDFGTVAGDGQNTAGKYATVGGGIFNTASGLDSTVSGGLLNNATGEGTTVSGGEQNTASGLTATVGGGEFNQATSEGTTVNGGELNNANGVLATIGGDSKNTASGRYSTVPGGNGNVASGILSFAAGAGANAQDDSSFVWGDGSQAAYSQGANTFTVLATGGAYFFSSASGGAKLLPNQTSWTSISDRNAKKNFSPVDGETVLNKLAAIPIERWNYKWEKDSDVPNIGPMAQDFKAAFYPGRDDKGISTLEFDGVELAAIQGLNQKLEEKDAKINDLEKRLEKLEQLLTTKSESAK
jgi:hypothetical protein